MADMQHEQLDVGDDAQFLAAFAAVSEHVAEDVRMLTALLVARSSTGRGPDVTDLGLHCLQLSDYLRFERRRLATALTVRSLGPVVQAEENTEGSIIDYVAYVAKKQAHQSVLESAGEPH